MKKLKPVDLAEIEPLVKNATWVRRQGIENALPPGVNVPAETLYHVTVSGSLEQPRQETKHGQTGDVVAAWEVFRFDPKDAPTVFNTAMGTKAGSSVPTRRSTRLTGSRTCCLGTTTAKC